VICLAPGASKSFDLRIEGLVTPDQVQAAAQQVARLQANIQPQILKQPREDWCGAPPPL